jgi:lipopolysaccharide/colanic/teichoic acid biosynthesis glycosyltransferase
VLVLLVAPPLLVLAALIAVAVFIDSRGPVLFAQDRTGYNGERFRMLKFRTMRPDAAEMKAELAHLNVLTFPDFKIPNDPRITRVGRFLRRTSLDEIPQLWNVLRNDMSLVGPRPTSFDASTYELWHTARLEVRPGITGLWQVERQGPMSLDERFRLDAEYVRTMSVRTDLRLLLATGGAVFRLSGQ